MKLVSAPWVNKLPLQLQNLLRRHGLSELTWTHGDDVFVFILNLFLTERFATDGTFSWPSLRPFMRQAKLDSRRLKPLLTIQPQTQLYLQHIGKSFAQAAPRFIIHSQSQTISHMHTPIMHLICPPKFCITFVFHFLLGITAVPREIGNNAYAKFWEGNTVHYGNVQVAHSNFQGLIITPLVGLI